jgi:hypothetical protein
VGIIDAFGRIVVYHLRSSSLRNMLRAVGCWVKCPSRATTAESFQAGTARRCPYLRVLHVATRWADSQPTRRWPTALLERDTLYDGSRKGTGVPCPLDETPVRSPFYTTCPSNPTTPKQDPGLEFY